MLHHQLFVVSDRRADPSKSHSIARACSLATNPSIDTPTSGSPGAFSPLALGGGGGGAPARLQKPSECFEMLKSLQTACERLGVTTSRAASQPATTTEAKLRLNVLTCALLVVHTLRLAESADGDDLDAENVEYNALLRRLADLAADSILWATKHQGPSIEGPSIEGAEHGGEGTATLGGQVVGVGQALLTVLLADGKKRNRLRGDWRHDQVVGCLLGHLAHVTQSAALAFTQAHDAVKLASAVAADREAKRQTRAAQQRGGSKRSFLDLRPPPPPPPPPPGQASPLVGVSAMLGFLLGAARSPSLAGMLVDGGLMGRLASDPLLVAMARDAARARPEGRHVRPYTLSRDLSPFVLECWHPVLELLATLLRTFKMAGAPRHELVRGVLDVLRALWPLVTSPLSCEAPSEDRAASRRPRVSWLQLMDATAVLDLLALLAQGNTRALDC